MIRDICNVLAAMGGTSIELYEWQRPSVMMSRLPKKPAWSSYSVPTGRINFTGVNLAHAVIKADYLVVRNYALPSLGFLLQMDQIIDFSSSTNLRLIPGASSILNDVTQSSVIGRVGQGLALLFAASRGYGVVGHLASDPSVIAHLPSAASEKVADFLFEDVASERMIMESKATVSLDQNRCSPVKAVLKRALGEQVDPWMGIVKPSPTKGYAIYSCLRETGGATPSAIMFVDPPEQKGEFQIELPRDWVRRHNYAAWLRVMGLGGAADRLREARGRQKSDDVASSTQFHRIRINDREFAVLISLDRPKEFENKCFAIGMDLLVLKMVSATIQGRVGALGDYVQRPFRYDDKDAQLSILPDGTLFGLVDVKAFDGVENIQL